MASRCDFSDLPADMCGHCTGAEVRARTEERTERKGTTGPWFTAAFAGECVGCGCHISPDDTIRASAGYGYECRECGDAADLEGPS